MSFLMQLTAVSWVSDGFCIIVQRIFHLKDVLMTWIMLGTHPLHLSALVPLSCSTIYSLHDFSKNSKKRKMLVVK